MMIFAIGSRQWPGLSKLAEESGELTNVIGRILDGHGQNEASEALRRAFVEELGDVLAACAFVIEVNELSFDPSQVKPRVKEVLFGLDGVVVNVFVKLAQELGTVVQVIGKLMGTGGEVEHWDGTNLRERLQDAIYRLLGVGAFASVVCDVDGSVEARKLTKLTTFRTWHADELSRAR